MKGKIALNGMEFHSYHGVYDFEREKGSVFQVDVAFELDLERPAATDNIQDTLDYVAVYELIAREMETPVNLLEHLAAKITQRLLDSFPQAEQVELRVAKSAPPVGGTCKESAVTLVRSRQV